MTNPRVTTDLRKNPPRVQLKDESHVEVEEISHTRPTHRIVIELNQATANLIWSDLTNRDHGEELDPDNLDLNHLTANLLRAIQVVARR